MADFNQYSTAQPYLTASASPWIADPLEALRVASYGLYEQIYWSHPETFALVQRGSEANPIYLPSGRAIVDTMQRYLARGIQFIPNPLLGTPEQQATTMAFLADLTARERFASKFSVNKLEGIFRGDWAWFIKADPDRPEGTRLSIQTIDPASIFPVFDDDDLDTIIGWHIVEQFNDGSQDLIRRSTYRKVTETGGPSPISYEVSTFKMDDWGGPGMEQDPTPEAVEFPVTVLPQPIDQFPIYVIQNQMVGGSKWGSSELRGLERLLGAMNQAISDEDLALALESLGVYATNAGHPVDENGDDIPWDIGPGRVVEVPNTGDGLFFSRVPGITSVQPFQDHINFLARQAAEATGQNDVSRGQVTVEEAESFIALQLRLGPILARAEDKELVINDVMGNLVYDLGKWIQAYEPAFAAGFDTVRFTPIYSDKIPVNRKQRFDEIMQMFTAKLVPTEWVVVELRKLGYDLPDDLLNKQIEEETARGLVESDAQGARLDNELEQQQVD